MSGDEKKKPEREPEKDQPRKTGGDVDQTVEGSRAEGAAGEAGGQEKDRKRDQ